MNRVRAYLRLTRPVTTLSGSLAVLLGGYVAGTGAWTNIVLAMASTLLASGAANAWNDCLDIEIDRINQPHRVLPSGQMSTGEAWRFSLVLTGLALVLAAFINWPAFLVALGSTLVLYLYSWRLKSTVLMGNATIAAISATSAIYGGVAAGNVQPSLWLAVVIATAIMGREVLKTLADYEGDLRERVSTIATAWGRRRARIVFYLLVAATVWMMFLPYLMEVYSPVYAYIVAGGVCPVIIYVMLRVSRSTSPQQLERLSQLMKYDFFVWFVAVLLGA